MCICEGYLTLIWIALRVCFASRQGFAHFLLLEHVSHSSSVVGDTDSEMPRRVEPSLGGLPTHTKRRWGGGRGMGRSGWRVRE